MTRVMHFDTMLSGRRPAGMPARLAAALLSALGAALLAVVVYFSGAVGLDAPWIQGDEFIFIAGNPEVTGADDARPFLLRCAGTFGHAHEDIYQPITILSYALEWALWGDARVQRIRQTDVCIHILNALLAWAALSALLVRFSGATRPICLLVGWSFALLWAQHPMLVGAYAADMGRTHLLSTTFTLASLLAYLRAVPAPGAPPPAPGWFPVSTALLILAMLNKPIVGWVLVAACLELALARRWTRAATVRVATFGVICASFALLTLWSTRKSLLLDDAPLPLFGDPVARACLGLAVYFRNFLVPGPWLSPWYPPDVRTGWGNPPTWLGAAGLGAIAMGILLCLRRSERRGVAVGLTWFVAAWFPVSGVVGARVAAAQDRYLYMPLLGLLLGLALLMARWIAARDARREAVPRVYDEPAGPAGPSALVRRPYGAWALALVASALALAAMPRNAELAVMSRSTLQRALRADALFPDDPRVLEMLAAAYSFGIAHPTPEMPAGGSLVNLKPFEAALERAAGVAERRPQFFPDSHQRAAFHRRMSFQLWNVARAYENSLHESLRAGEAYLRSLEQARRAADFEPEAVRTWERIAHALRSMSRWREAREAFERLEALLPPDHADRGRHLTDFGTLLLYVLDQPGPARERFQAALSGGGLTDEVREAATLGLARCEVLVGKGEAGLRLARSLLERRPDNLPALLVVGLFHLRSHHWEQADLVYTTILTSDPTHYEALRAYHELSAQTDRWDAAVAAWAAADAAAPGTRAFRSFLVWSRACADDAEAEAAARSLVQGDPGNPMACLALMLVDVRAGRVEQALGWIEASRVGSPIPEGRELARAEGTLSLLRQRGRLPADAAVVHAAVCAALGQSARAEELAGSYLRAHPESPWRATAERLAGRSGGGAGPPDP
jgi:tetratricopeptide (TPR) repeat protein